MSREYSNLECDWASAGAAFSVPRSFLRPDVDPERLVCDILSAIPLNPRYAPIFVIWIGRFGKMLDANRLHEMLSSMPPENSILYRALIGSGVGAEVLGLSERVQAIVLRAHDPRLLPLAKSKVKQFDHVVGFNSYFSSR
jgi:hypothetical protein